MSRYSPWRQLRSLPGLRLDFTDDEALLDEADGRYYHHVKRILMSKGLLQVERRCILAHELAHALRGDLPCGDARLDERQEAAVEQWAARRLIELPALADALRWSDDLDEVADELWVTPDLLQVRLQHLHPSEAGWLRHSLNERPLNPH
jgi:hypothetical protein